MSAIVKPAKAPPSSTRPTATAKYIHNVGLSGGIGGSSSPLRIVKVVSLTGAALSGRLTTPKTNSLKAERNNGRATV